MEKQKFSLLQNTQRISPSFSLFDEAELSQFPILLECRNISSLSLLTAWTIFFPKQKGRWLGRVTRKTGLSSSGELAALTEENRMTHIESFSNEII